LEDQAGLGAGNEGGELAARPRQIGRVRRPVHVAPSTEDGAEPGVPGGLVLEPEPKARLRYLVLLDCADRHARDGVEQANPDIVVARLHAERRRRLEAEQRMELGVAGAEPQDLALVALLKL